MKFVLFSYKRYYFDFGNNVHSVSFRTPVAAIIINVYEELYFL